MEFLTSSDFIDLLCKYFGSIITTQQYYNLCLISTIYHKCLSKYKHAVVFRCSKGKHIYIGTNFVCHQSSINNYLHYIFNYKSLIIVEFAFGIIQRIVPWNGNLDNCYLHRHRRHNNLYYRLYYKTRSDNDYIVFITDIVEKLKYIIVVAGEYICIHVNNNTYRIISQESIPEITKAMRWEYSHPLQNITPLIRKFIYGA